jgi:hypothetical protein
MGMGLGLQYCKHVMTLPPDLQIQGEQVWAQSLLGVRQRATPATVSQR